MFFFLTVYLENWEYSQRLLSEEALPNNSCESPRLPPSFPLSPPLVFSSSFLHFPVSNTKREAVLWAAGLRHTHTVSGELMKGDPLDACYQANLRVCLLHCLATLSRLFFSLFFLKTQLS